MNQPAHISVLLATLDVAVIYRDWTGVSIRVIHKNANAKYAKGFPGARVSFSSAWYSNNYGAHWDGEIDLHTRISSRELFGA